MNPLQEYPHLFANGKFKVSYSGYEQLIRKVIGIRRKLRDWALVESDIEGKEGALEIEYCTLIARPIADMTDEEVYSLPIVKRCFDGDKNKANSADEIKYYLIRHARKGTLPISDGLAMGDIGVYFGPQSHFKDGTVININEV